MYCISPFIEIFSCHKPFRSAPSVENPREKAEFDVKDEKRLPGSMVESTEGGVCSIKRDLCSAKDLDWATDVLMGGTERSKD